MNKKQTFAIDNIPLDEFNEEFNYAADFIKHTNKMVFLTGKAGTGKTTFLKYLRATTEKKMVVLAPTGVAAINAGGQTLHSFFNIPPGLFHPEDDRLRERPRPEAADKSTIYDHFTFNTEKLELIKEIDLLVIDEVSMVRCDLLDVIDKLLRVFRKRRAIPFGGVQVVLIGDVFQLPPVVRNEDWSILNNFYSSPFFFSSKVIENNRPVYIELKKIYRQKEQDFINLLNLVRINDIGVSGLQLLNNRYNPSFVPRSEDNYVTLGTKNIQVEAINQEKLQTLTGSLYESTARISGIFPENTFPTDRVLKLKVGAQIMFIKNDPERRFYNGKIAKVVRIDDEGVFINLGGDNEVRIEQQEWKNVRYTWNEELKKIEEETIGSFTQYPIKLAWAITVHKSQGLTFEKVVADLGGAFASGQVYVALSRCTSLNGLVLKSKINKSDIKTDPRVIEFAKNETPNTLIVQELNSGKADTYYRKVLDSIDKLDFVEAYNFLISAIRLRNDLETETFKRYFLIISERFALRKRILETALLKKNSNEISDLEIRNKDLLDKLDLLTKNNRSLKISGLLAQGDLTELKRKLESQEEKNINQLEKIDSQNKIIQEQKQYIGSLQLIIKRNEEEIANFKKKKKWYHKFFN